MIRQIYPYAMLALVVSIVVPLAGADVGIMGTIIGLAIIIGRDSGLVK